MAKGITVFIKFIKFNKNQICLVFWLLFADWKSILSRKSDIVSKLENRKDTEDDTLRYTHGRNTTNLDF